MEYGERIISFLEMAAGLLKAGCRVAGLLIGFVFMIFVLVSIVKAVKEAGEEE